MLTKDLLSTITRPNSYRAYECVATGMWKNLRLSWYSTLEKFSHLVRGQNVKQGEVGRVSGIPEEHLRRKVRIYVPARNPEQQGVAKTKHWKMEWVNQEKWANPLMGWTSTADPLSQTELSFPSKDAAITFAEKHGWSYEIDEPKKQRQRMKSYGDNFKYIPPEDEED